MDDFATGYLAGQDGGNNNGGGFFGRLLSSLSFLARAQTVTVETVVTTA